MIKIFITYYLIAGFLNLYYTHKYWEETQFAYPQLGILGKDFVCFLQFVLGFILILTWFPKYLWISLDEWLHRRRFNRNLAPQAEIRELIADEIEAFKRERERMRREILKKYSSFIQDRIDLGENKLKSIFGEISCTMDDLKADILGGMESPFSQQRENKYILIKKDHFIILPEDKVPLMQGWQIACIISNPFPNGKQQSPKV